MFEISVSATFEATHQLRYADGTFETPHAHAWHVTATYAGPGLNDAGVLVDFGVVRERLRELCATLAGQSLNGLPVFAECQPSAENVAVVLAEGLPRSLPGAVCLRCVAVEEEPGCVARYWPE